MIQKWSNGLLHFLDPCFKPLSAASPTTQREVLQELHEKIELSPHTNNLPTINKAPDTKMSSFFGNGIDPSTSSPIDTEIQIYLSIPQIPKYDPKDPRYKKYNLLGW